MLWLRTRRAPALGLAATLLFTSSVLAQRAGTKPVGQTRAELEARARRADSLRQTEEAFRLRARLQNGDFEVGDRMYAVYEGVNLTRADSLVVQSGKIIRLGEPMGDLSVHGLLVAEVADSIRSRVEKYFRGEVVHVIPLLRLSISGAVRAPGFYYAGSDARLSDVIMRVGQDQNSDLSKVTIKRREQVLWAAADVQAALRDGLTLEYLGIEPGDDIIVGAQQSKGFGMFINVLVPTLSALLIGVIVRR